MSTILTRAEVKLLPKVATFLDGKARDAPNTAKAYATGLRWMAEYLTIRQSPYDLQSIIEPMKEKDPQKTQLDPYIILDE
ncbi:MAG TPA: hypothetical protein VGQ13_03920, partial [Nitrososphaera sp.]|nr:hypothetical protein [Nitrososphaera sp.]